MEINKIYQGDSLEVLKTFPDESIDCVITSPPYWGLRDYGVEGQLGLEKTPEEYVAKMVEVFQECKRVLKKEGTLWLNLGDSYAGGGRGGDPKHKKGDNSAEATAESYKGIPAKNLVGIPWRVAFALQADGWYLRQDIIWAKPNPMPESVTDRCTKSHEYIFLLTKSPKYYFDNEAIKETATGYDGRKDIVMKGSKKYANGFVPGQSAQNIAVKGHERWKKRKNDGTNYGGNGTGLHGHSGYSNIENPFVRNKRSVWTVSTKPFKEAHFATFPEDLIVPMILAGCPPKGIVLDIFMGAGTTAVVAKKLGRNYIGIELNKNYIDMANKRLAQKNLF